MTRILLAFIFIQTLSWGQVNFDLEEKRYKNGRRKEIATRHGTDTLEIKSYYKNGQPKDSGWYYLPKGNEIPLGTVVSYYENGILSTLTNYKNGYDAYVSYDYDNRGTLRRFDQRPTGVSMYFDKNGRQVREYDNHQLKGVYVSSYYRKNRHLATTSYANRIHAHEALLVQNDKQVNLKPGILLSLRLHSDTSLMTHCQIEGFSKDSIYFSRFHYNETYAPGTGQAILKYDSTFVVSITQIKTLRYSPHHTQQRNLGGLLAEITGAELLIFEALALPVLPFIMDFSKSNLLNTAYIYVGITAIGLPLYYYGKYLFRSAVPVTYDLSTWKIVISD